MSTSYVIYMVAKDADLHIHVSEGSEAKLHAMPVDLARPDTDVVAAFEALLDSVRTHEFAKGRSRS